MNRTRIVLLGAIAAAMVLYITKVELASDNEKLANTQPFQTLSLKALETVSIVSPEGSFTLINNAVDKNAKPEPRDEGFAPTPILPQDLPQWQIKGIAGSELDRTAMNALTQGIKELSLDQAVAAADVGSDLGIFGLAAPEVTVSVNANGQQTSLEFGSFNDFVSRRYLKMSGRDGLFLVNADLYNAAKKKAEDFRSRNPVDFVDADIQTFGINDASDAAKNLQLKFEQAETGVWRMSEPVAVPASRFAIDNTLRELRTLRATAFIDQENPDKAAFGLDKPQLTFTLNFRESAKRDPLQIELATKSELKDGKSEDAYYFSVSGKKPIFKLQGEFLGRLSKKVLYYREKRLFKFDPAAAQGLEIVEAGEAPLVVTRAGKDWMVGDKPGDEPFIRQVLTNLSELEAVEFPASTEKLGFDSPHATITVTLGTNEKRVLTIGAQQPGENWSAIVVGTTQPFLITTEAMRKLLPHREALLLAEKPEPLMDQAGK